VIRARPGHVMSEVVPGIPRTAKGPWRKWGPYLSEPQWGTVREINRLPDGSAGGV
jgi:hypothetical protein